MSFRKLAAALFLLPALHAAVAGAQTLYTIAGSGDVMIDTGDGTAGTTTYIHRPQGIVPDGAGNVYFTDESGFAKIRKLDLVTGIITTYAGGGSTDVVEGAPALGAFLGDPQKIALDAAGNLYIADTTHHRVLKVDVATGFIYTVAGTGTAGYSGDGGSAIAASLNYPSGVAVDAAGNVYVSDRNNSRVRMVSAATGAISTVAGNGTADISGDGGPATGGSLNYPEGIALDAAGNLFIADTGNYRIRRVSSGVITTVVGSGTSFGFSGDGGPAVDAVLSHPRDVAVGPGGELLIADTGNQRIRRAIVGGNIATVAGNGDPYFNGESLPALETSLYAPMGVGIDHATGAIFIADTNNYRIRSFVPVGSAPQTITFAPFAVRTYDIGEVLTLSATASSGLAVTFTSLTTGTCTVSGTTLTLVANGTCTVAADQAGNATYVAAARVTRSLTVGTPVTGPGAFTFVDQVDVPPGRPITSNTIVVTGIPTLAISVTGGSYSLDCNGVFTTAPGTITDGQSVCVQHVSSFSAGTPTDTVLTIGTTSDTFTSTTMASNRDGIIAGYYLGILRRAADAGGLAYWESEAARLAGLGGDVNETWRAMALAFFGSAEYASFGRTDTEFVVDLYNTFFGRAPDAQGLAYWTGLITSGVPRQVVLLSFLFSSEFDSYMQRLFGTMTTRPEATMVVDFYRGFLARLPDSAGFQFWSERFRVARCTSAAAVRAEADAISQLFFESAEYVARGRSNQQFVSDLYNGFMRRGADLVGVQYWENQLNTAALTRDQLRRIFLGSEEFQARVTTLAARGCS
jgi:sugar lactone lactonase YvrE